MSNLTHEGRRAARERTHEEAMALIDAERLARLEKTKKLRALRLGQATVETPAKQRAKSRRKGATTYPVIANSRRY